MGNAKISDLQFTILVVMYTLGSTILIIPAPMTAMAKSNAWIASIAGLLIGILFIFIYIRISVLFPDKTFVEINKMIFGKWIGNLLSILFLFTVFIMSTANLREFGDFFTTQVMVETPIHAIHILILIAAIYCIRNGLEVIARTSEIFFPWSAFFLLILIFFLIPEMKFQNLNPNFAKGVGPIAAATYPYLSLPFGELVVFLMIMPYVSDVAKARKGYLIGVFCGGIGTVMVVVMCIAVLGADLTARSLFPTYILGKKISIGGFLERIEVLVAISWIFSLFFKLLVNIFVILLGLSQILNMNNIQPLVIPLGFILMVYSFVNFPNVVYINEIALKTWPTFSLTFFLLLPCIVLILAHIKTKVKNQGMHG